MDRSRGLTFEGWFDIAWDQVDEELALSLMGDWDSIGWASLEHAYGSADNIPGLLYALFSRDADAAEAMLDALINDIAHQGTVYPATPYVLPYLQRMLIAGKPFPREVILRELARMARRSAAEPTPPALEAFYAACHRDDARRGEDRGAYLAIKRAIYGFLLDHQHTYEELLRDPAPQVRAGAAQLLRALRNQETAAPPEG